MKFQNIKIGLLCFSIFLSASLYADKDAVNGRNCITKEFDPNNTFVTFYGDSLGDFVDEPLYGYFDWEFYLLTRKPEINWNIQNLAIGGNTTKSNYEFIQLCTNASKRSNFRTTDNIALEIGGNDFKDNAALLTYMPWKDNQFLI